MKKMLGVFVAASLTLGVAQISLAQTEDPAVAVVKSAQSGNTNGEKLKGKMTKLETIECTGVLQVTPPDTTKKQKYSTVTLKEGDKEYKLLPGKDKKSFAELEKLAGKTVVIVGALLPANDKHPLAAIKVDSFKEVVVAVDESKN